MAFAKRTEWTFESNILARTLADLRQKRVSIFDLTLSNPTLCKFRYLEPGLLKPFSDSGNLVYSPDAHGLRESREIICRYHAEKGVLIRPEQVFVTSSTSEAYNFVLRLLAEPGDLILAPQPSYPLLNYLAQLNDVRMSRYALDEKDSWKIDPDEIKNKMPENPKAILFVHPNNPAGSYVSKEERSALARLLKSYNVAAIADEVFFDFAFSSSSPAQTFAAQNEILTFTISGISKVLGLPQMKLSWIVVTGPEELKRQAIQRLEIIADTYLSVSTPVQRALPVWFKNLKQIQGEIRERLLTNQDFLTEQLKKQDKIRLKPVQGGWSQVLAMPVDRSDEDWALLFLEKEHVAVHPGYLFDFEYDFYIVLSLLVEPGIFQEGISRILKRLGK